MRVGFLQQTGRVVSKIAPDALFKDSFSVDWVRQLYHLFATPEGLQQLIAWGGLLALFCIVFAETGLLVGFFLPGDSLLFVAGFMSSPASASASASGQPLLNIWLLILALSLAAIIGDTVGYWVGKKAGAALYDRPQSRWFRRDHLLKTRAFYEKYGGLTIVLARFVPFARTFAPVVAGVAEMRYHNFIVYNICGGIGWVTCMSLLGYFLGYIPWVGKNIEKVILLIICLSLLPVAWHAWKMWRAGRAAGPRAPAPPAAESVAAERKEPAGDF